MLVYVIGGKTMMLFNCKACGGNVIPNEDGFTGKCEYCGSMQTLPKDKDERISQFLNRANDYRLNSEFDRAIFEYEKVLEINEKEPEAHWGIFLSKYGVEYVKDTMTLSYKPTLHRLSSVSVFDDVDYKATLRYASSVSAFQYENKAKDIEQVMKELLSLSANQEPFDVFLSYKEVDDVTRQRTDDSYLAHDLYNELTAQGYKVFFAPKSLGAGLYEPKIYSAIISSKVMIVLGTKPQYFDAVWVKNEWSRFAELIENGEEKALIPVFKNMKAEELPNRLAKYQALDMSNISFLPTLFNMLAEAVAKRKANVKFNGNATAEEVYLERGFLALEDNNFSQAESFFENALNLNPHSSQAYFGKLMVEMRISKQSQILTSSRYLNTYQNFDKAVRFAEHQLKTTLIQYEKSVKNALDTQEYNKQKSQLNDVQSEKDIIPIIENLQKIEYFKDAKVIIQYLNNTLNALSKNEQKVSELKKEIADNSEKLINQKNSLKFHDESHLFTVLGIVCGVISSVYWLVSSLVGYGMLGIIIGPGGAAMLVGIGYVVGRILDFTIGKLLLYIYHILKRKKRNALVKELEKQIEVKQKNLSDLENEYYYLLADVKSFNSIHI